MTPSIKITIDARRTQAMLTRMRSLSLRPILRLSAVRFEDLMKKHTPVSHDVNQPAPGKLRSGWRADTDLNEGQSVSRILVRNMDPRAAKIWPILQKSTKPHVIKAVRMKMLAFRHKSGDQFVGPRVKHPGARRAVDPVALRHDLETELQRLKRLISEAYTKAQQGV